MAAACKQFDIYLQLVKGVHLQLAVEVTVVGLDRTGADTRQLRDILNGIAVHIILQDGTFRAGQRTGPLCKAPQPCLHIRRQRSRWPITDGGKQLVDLRDTGSDHLCTGLPPDFY